MKNLMKNLAMALFFFVTTIFVAHAQDEMNADIIKAEGKTPQEKAENQAKKLTEKLALSAEQTPQVQAALLERMTKGQNIKATIEKGGGKRIKAAKEIGAEFDSKMKSILTPEQYTKFEQLREDRKDKRKENKGKSKKESESGK